jgi:hypothetical protein
LSTYVVRLQPTSSVSALQREMSLLRPKPSSSPMSLGGQFVGVSQREEEMEAAAALEEAAAAAAARESAETAATVVVAAMAAATVIVAAATPDWTLQPTLG